MAQTLVVKVTLESCMSNHGHTIGYWPTVWGYMAFISGIRESALQHAKSSPKFLNGIRKQLEDMRT
jgi:hypothetical protein